MRSSEAGQLLLHLSFSLLGVYLLFIVCVISVRHDVVCAVAGGLLHYFLLVTFFLMAAEAISLYAKLVIVLGVPDIIKRRFILKATLISWSKYTALARDNTVILLHIASSCPSDHCNHQ